MKRGFSQQSGVTDIEFSQSSYDMPVKKTTKTYPKALTKTASKYKKSRKIVSLNDRIHSFRRIVTIPTTDSGFRIDMYCGPVAGGGFNASGIFDIQFAFSLSKTYIYLGGALTATLTNSGYSDFANLFDFYRIRKVYVKFDFTSNGSQVTTNQQLPILITAPDANDASQTTYLELQQYGAAKTHILGNDRNTTMTRVCTPRVQTLLYNGVSSAYGESMPGPWVNTNSPDCIHYAMKIAYDPVFITGSHAILGCLYPTFTYYFDCKNPK